MGELTRVSVTMDGDILEKFDRWRRDQGFPTRSEAVGHLVRSALVEQEWKAGSEVAGVITIIYDHHKIAILSEIVQAQHDSGAVVLCSQHAHLSHDSCLENIIVCGKVKEIRALFKKLQKIKGLKHSVLSMTTTGDDI